MEYKTKNQHTNRLSGYAKASLTGLFVLLAILSARAEGYWKPNTDAFDIYMTITGYILLDGKELQDDQYEVGCFIDGECRGSYQLQPMEYMDHPYACFLSVWGSMADNGKAITVKVYNHTTKKVLEAEQKPAYQYNGDIGTNNPYELTLTSEQVSQDDVDIAAAKDTVEKVSYTATQVNVASQAQAKVAVEAILGKLSLNGVTTTVVNNAFTAAVAGNAAKPSGNDGSYSFTVNLNKGSGTQQTTIRLTLTITATPYTPPATYLVTVNTTGNGTVSTSPTGPITANTDVTLTISPARGYELEAIKAYKSDDVNTPVSLSGNSTTRTFAMPAYNMTVDATFKNVQAQYPLDLSAQKEDIIIGFDDEKKVWHYTPKAILKATPAGATAFNGTITGTLLSGKVILIDPTAKGTLTFDNATVQAGNSRGNAITIASGADVTFAGTLKATSSDPNGTGIAVTEGASLAIVGAGTTLTTSGTSGNVVALGNATVIFSAL